MGFIFIFVKNQTDMDRDKLGIEEYSGHVYENISKIIINQNYINENIDFFEKIIFKMWEQYYYSTVEYVSINKQLAMLELFLSAMIELRPTQELPEDYL